MQILDLLTVFCNRTFSVNAIHNFQFSIYLKKICLEISFITSILTILIGVFIKNTKQYQPDLNTSLSLFITIW